MVRFSKSFLFYTKIENEIISSTIILIMNNMSRILGFMQNKKAWRHTAPRFRFIDSSA